MSVAERDSIAGAIRKEKFDQEFGTLGTLLNRSLKTQTFYNDRGYNNKQVDELVRLFGSGAQADDSEAAEKEGKTVMA